MENLIIIGNGFDLAHGLKTSYQSFYEDLKSKTSANPTKYKNIAAIQKPDKSYQLAPKYAFVGGGTRSYWENIFLRIFSRFNSLSTWADIEYLYFRVLQNYREREYFKSEFQIDFNFKSAEEVNKQFEVIKNYLKNYLATEETRFVKLGGYEQFFSQFSSRKTLILNFNYTTTVHKYIEGEKDGNLIQMHGELDSKDNPMIFGFAASDAESKELVDRNEDELLANIKRINYKLTNNEPRLLEFLEASEDIEVFILGHSCGISDRLILSQIFNHQNVKTIRPFHYDGMNGYRKTSIGIDRIIDDYSKEKGESQAYTKLLNYPECYPMLQGNSSEEECDKFVKYVSTVLTQKEREKTRKLAEEAARIAEVASQLP